jgi:hypothetical protein
MAAAKNAPYGDVEYADNGMQPDGKKRYPLDSEAHCRSAWAYIHQADNAAKYSPDHLRLIKQRIQAAGKKYGITFAEPVKAAARMERVEIARTGKWRLSTGELEVTSRDLDDAARFAAREGARPSPLKIGHTDQRFKPGDGEPALGWLSNLRVEEDDDGEDVLYGDIDGMPEWLAEAMPTAWPDRSMEGYAGYVHEGEKYGLVVDGLALLGVTPPGMGSLKSLRDLPTAVGVAASAQPLPPSGFRIVASFGVLSPASEAVVSPTERTGMNPEELREALGLSADASDEDVHTAVDAIVPRPKAVAAAANVPPGMRLVSDSNWTQREETIQSLTTWVTRAKANERDDYIAKAVGEGKFTPAQKPHFAKLWDADPDGTRAVIDSLQRNSALAVMASGYAGGDYNGGDEDPAYAALWGSVTRAGGVSRG